MHSGSQPKDLEEARRLEQLHRGPSIAVGSIPWPAARSTECEMKTVLR